MELLHLNIHLNTDLLYSLVLASSNSQDSQPVQDPCGDLPLVLSGSSTGIIQSPNYPNDYPNGADCKWVVEVDGSSVVQLTITNFNVETR